MVDKEVFKNKPILNEILSKPKRFRKILFAGVLLFLILSIYLAVKFWNTGTLKIGGYYINGWTPFNNIESYFYFGKYNRNDSFYNLINKLDTAKSQERFTPTGKVDPTPTPNYTGPDESENYIMYDFKIPNGWEFGTNAWGGSVIQKGNPYCNCSYECYGIDEVCKEEEINTYGEINVLSTNFCDYFNYLFKEPVFSSKCEGFDTEKLVMYKDLLLQELNTNELEENGCGPYFVSGKANVTEIAGFTTLERSYGDSCRYPNDKEYYIFLPDRKGDNLLKISVKNYNLYKSDVDKALSTFKIIEDPWH